MLQKRSQYRKVLFWLLVCTVILGITLLDPRLWWQELVGTNRC